MKKRKYLTLLVVLIVLSFGYLFYFLFHKESFFLVGFIREFLSDSENTDEENTEINNMQPYLYHAVSSPLMMVRALKFLQNDVAKGRTRALQKQAQTLLDIARTFSVVDFTLFEDEKNFQALLTYLFSGGNAEVVADILRRLSPEKRNLPLFKGAMAYALGHYEDLVHCLSEAVLDSREWSKDLHLSVLLAELADFSAIDPKLADANLDYVRLSAPGTLFEEAAIRRQINLSAYLGNVEKIRLLSRNYIKRFSNSAYINNFWSEFVQALQFTESKMNNEELTSLINLAPPKMQYLTYLYLARTTLLDGKTERAQYNAIEAHRLGENLNIHNPSILFYYAASQVSSIFAPQAVKILRSIVPDSLEIRDRLLYEVVLRVAESVQFSSKGKTKKSSTNFPPLWETDAAENPDSQNYETEKKGNLLFSKKDPLTHPIRNEDFDAINTFLTETQEKIHPDIEGGLK